MNTRRRLVAALGACALASPLTSLAPLAAFAQEAGKVRRIGFLGVRSRSTPSNPDVYYDAFVQGMRELGYVEGKNRVIEWRFADGKYERLPDLADTLVQMKVEVIVTHSTPGTRAAQQVTSSIPVVTAAALDVVGSGFAKSLAHPGGNITGLTQIVPDVTPKHIELLRIIVPRLSRVAVLMNPGNTAHSGILKGIQATAQQVGIKVLSIEARTSEEITHGFATMARDRAGAVIVIADGFFIGQKRLIAEAGIKNRMPTMSSYREDVEAGGLMSYGQNVADFYWRAATYVDKILKGTKPGDIPIEQPMRIHLAINRKTAKALGLKINNEPLLRADEIIE